MTDKQTVSQTDRQSDSLGAETKLTPTQTKSEMGFEEEQGEEGGGGKELRENQRENRKWLGWG